MASKPDTPTATGTSSISMTDTTITVAPMDGKQYLVVKVTSPETVPTESAWSSYGKIADGTTPLVFKKDSSGDTITAQTLYKIYVRVPANDNATPKVPASDVAKSDVITTM